MVLARTVVVVVLAVLGVCRNAWSADQADGALRAELEAMFVTDQAQRAEIQARSIKKDIDAQELGPLWEKQRASDEANIKRLVELVDIYGWPQQSKVGGKAAAAAWAVVQHADLVQQKRFLPLIREAVAKGEAQASNQALLEDRILVREGKPQIYGSQISVDRLTHKYGFHPIEDEPNVDKRRAEVGLGPLSEYAKRFGFEYAPAVVTQQHP